MRWTLALVFLTTGLVSAASGQATKLDQEVEIQLAERTLKQAKIKIDNDSLLQFFKERTLPPTEEGRVAELLKKLGDASYTNRVAATAQLLKAGPMALPFLKNGLKAKDQEVVCRIELCLSEIIEKNEVPKISAAALLLGHRKAPGAAKTLLDFLPFAENEEVILQVQAALKQVAVEKNGKPTSALIDALKDKYALRRAVAGALLAPLADHKSAVRGLLKDPDPIVRLWVALALLKVEEEQAVPVLIGLLDELKDEDVWQVEDTLLRIAGDTAPDVSVDQTASAEVRKAWTAWWNVHKKKIGPSLAEYAKTPSFLNYTLITQMGGGGGINGEVFELAPNQKVRWKIPNLRYPVDAQIVGRNHVLVAEYLNRRVTEYDFDGKVHWSMQVDLPIGVQRLPNGNTFLACRRQLVEVDRTRKQVFHFGSKIYIAAARKMPNGQIVLVDNIGKLVHLDKNGKKIGTFQAGHVYTLGGSIDVLPGGRVLIPEYRNNRVAEYDLKGKLIRQVAVPLPISAIRLPNNNLLVASQTQQQVMEMTWNGKVVWSYRTNGRPWCARRR